MESITLTIPSDWLEGTPLSQDELRQALRLGLTQLRQYQPTPESARRVVQALLRTGRVRHMTATWMDDDYAGAGRQCPPTLPGPSVSEILIAQRRGEL
jgi:hypothetical protein